MRSACPARHYRAAIPAVKNTRAAAVRHAITPPPKTARQILTMFKPMLPRDLAVPDA